MESEYKKREIDHFMNDIKTSLCRIEVQTTKHNGRLSKIERAMLIIGTVTGVLLVTNGSNLINFIKLFI